MKRLIHQRKGAKARSYTKGVGFNFKLFTTDKKTDKHGYIGFLYGWGYPFEKIKRRDAEARRKNIFNLKNIPKKVLSYLAS